MKLLELFSGIGGFAKGFQDAGYHFTKHYFSEIDKHAIACYKYNFKDAEYIGSVEHVRGGGIERPNIITFGSPCQDFSLAGKQLGLNGTRSSLITEAIRLIGELRPDCFIWENVKGAFSSNNGEDFFAIIAAFAHIGGYRLEWQLLNTSWVLPQNRERIYLIGHLADRSECGVFPIRETDGLYTKPRAITEEIHPDNRTALTQQARQYASWNGDFIKVNQVNPKKQGEKFIQQQNRVFSTEGLMTCLHQDARNHILVNTNTQKGYDELKPGDSLNYSVPNSKTRRERIGKGVAQTLDTECNQGVLTVKPVLTINRLEKRQNGRRFKEDGEPAFTVNCQDQHGVMINNSIRRLTEIECERLQGFPDNWTKYGLYTEGVKEISKTQRYKMCGNAVTVKIVELIAQRLKITNP